MPGRRGSTSNERENDLIVHAAANVVALAHIAFVLFVVLGGLLVLRWRRLVWLHLPCVLWGALIEFTGWWCPLTPLENWLRRRAGSQGYSGGFVEHYLMPILYPAGLSRQVQVALGVTVLVINLAVYSWMATRKR